MTAQLRKMYATPKRLKAVRLWNVGRIVSFVQASKFILIDPSILNHIHQIIFTNNGFQFYAFACLPSICLNLTKHLCAKQIELTANY